jgi:hypothetical protein
MALQMRRVITGHDATGVRRQGLWDNGLIRIREALAHRIGDFRQPTAGAAGGGF